MSELMKKKTKTAREKAFHKLMVEIGERYADEEEKLEKAVARATEKAAEKTENGTKNKEAWAHTIPAIRNDVFCFVEQNEDEKENGLDVAKAAAEKARKKAKKK